MSRSSVWLGIIVLVVDVWMIGRITSRLSAEQPTALPAAESIQVEPDGKLHELDWSHKLKAALWCEEEVRLWDDSRVDLLTSEYAIEIDWAHKWAESFGQSQYYAETTNRKPAVILLVKDFDKEERHIYRAKIVAARLQVPVWLVDVKKKQLIRGSTVIAL